MLLRSLKIKYIIWLIPLILLISLSFLILFIYKSNRFAKKNLTDFGFHLIKNLSTAFEFAVASEDPILLQPVFGSTFEEEDVVLITVYNRKGHIVASKKKQRLKKEFTEMLWTS